MEGRHTSIRGPGVVPEVGWGGSGSLGLLPRVREGDAYFDNASMYLRRSLLILYQLHSNEVS